MKIKVEQKDIDAGKRGSCHYCPIALALKRHGMLFASVIPDKIAFKSPDGLVRLLELPEAAKQFVLSFDNGADVTPFEFEVNLETISYEDH